MQSDDAPAAIAAYVIAVCGPELAREVFEALAAPEARRRAELTAGLYWHADSLRLASDRRRDPREPSRGGAPRRGGWIGGRCRPIDFLQERQLTTR